MQGMVEGSKVVVTLTRIDNLESWFKNVQTHMLHTESEVRVRLKPEEKSFIP